MVGIESLLRELSEATDLFNQVDSEIDKLAKPLYQRIGVSPELVSMALAELLSGKDTEPLNQQREPKKQELIVAAFEAPANQAGRTSCFRRMTAFFGNSVMPVWVGQVTMELIRRGPRRKSLSHFFRAKINPRPQTKGPWNYEIRFGHHHTLVVQTGNTPGQVLTA